MKWLRFTVFFVVLAGLCEGCGPKYRVGTYDSRAIALAYGRSKMHNDRLDGLLARLKRAEASGAVAEVARLKAIPGKWQERIHSQVFGDAPIPDIIELIDDKLSAIRRQAGVRELADKRRYSPWRPTQQIDVTDAIVDLFDPSEQTRTYIRQLKER